MKHSYLFFLIFIGLLLSSFVVYSVDDGSIDQPKIVELYPNPATSVIYFEIPNNTEKTYTLLIFNFIGKKVNEFVISNSKIAVSLDNYYRGLYVYQLRDKNGLIIESGKFQVIK